VLTPAGADAVCELDVPIVTPASMEDIADATLGFIPWVLTAAGDDVVCELDVSPIVTPARIEDIADDTLGLIPWVLTAAGDDVGCELDALRVTPARIEDIADDTLGMIPWPLDGITELGIPEDGDKADGDAVPVGTVVDTVAAADVKGIITPGVDDGWELDPLPVGAVEAEPAAVLSIGATTGRPVDVTPNKLDIKLGTPPVALAVVVSCGDVEPKGPEVSEAGITLLPLPLGLPD